MKLEDSFYLNAFKQILVHFKYICAEIVYGNSLCKFSAWCSENQYQTKDYLI